MRRFVLPLAALAMVSACKKDAPVSAGAGRGRRARSAPASHALRAGGRRAGLGWRVRLQAAWARPRQGRRGVCSRPAAARVFP